MSAEGRRRSRRKGEAQLLHVFNLSAWWWLSLLLFTYQPVCRHLWHQELQVTFSVKS